MILGFFKLGRPFIRGRVSIDTLDAHGATVAHERDVDFLIDTGADATVLGFLDLTNRLRIPMTATVSGERFAAFGEEVQSRQIAGFVFFEHDDLRQSGYRLDFVVASTKPSEFDTSILGCNIILAGELRLNARSIELDLPILGA